MKENSDNFVNLGHRHKLTFAMQCSKKQTHNIGYKIDKLEATLKQTKAVNNRNFSKTKKTLKKSNFKTHDLQRKRELQRGGCH